MTDYIRPRFAIIPTNGRPCFKQCLEAIVDQVNEVVIVEGGAATPLLQWDFPIIREPELNISKWWNLGLSLVASKVKDQWDYYKRWDVAILNDDAIVPPGWFDGVSKGMRSKGAAAGCSGGHGVPHLVHHTQPGPVGLTTRLQGYAFILAGEKGVRANEQLRWYFSDDHVDWLARQLGGMVMVPGYGVNHLHPNEQVTPELQAIIAEDAAQFHAYWGMRPW